MRQQLLKLRRAMQAHGIDLYIIPTDDSTRRSTSARTSAGGTMFPASRAAQVRWW